MIAVLVMDDLDHEASSFLEFAACLDGKELLPLHIGLQDFAELVGRPLQLDHRRTLPATRQCQ